MDRSLQGVDRSLQEVLWPPPPSSLGVLAGYSLPPSPLTVLCVLPSCRCVSGWSRTPRRGLGSLVCQTPLKTCGSDRTAHLVACELPLCSHGPATPSLPGKDAALAKARSSGRPQRSWASKPPLLTYRPGFSRQGGCWAIVDTQPADIRPD